MLFNIDKINRFISLLMLSKTSVFPQSSPLTRVKQVGDGALLYGDVRAEIKIYMGEFNRKNRRIEVIFQRDYLAVVFDRDYFEKLIKSKFKAAFYGACTIQIVRYILQEVKNLPEFKIDVQGIPFLPSHKPEVAEFFFYQMKRTDIKLSPQASTLYENFICQAILRGGYDLHEFAVDKEALRFIPIDDVLAAHAVDVETCDNLFIAAERVNRIRALHHYYETDLTKWDGSEIQIELF